MLFCTNESWTSLMSICLISKGCFVPNHRGRNSSCRIPTTEHCSVSTPPWRSPRTSSKFLCVFLCTAAADNLARHRSCQEAKSKAPQSPVLARSVRAPGSQRRDTWTPLSFQGWRHFSLVSPQTSTLQWLQLTDPAVVGRVFAKMSSHQYCSKASNSWCDLLVWWTNLYSLSVPLRNLKYGSGLPLLLPSLMLWSTVQRAHP